MKQLLNFLLKPYHKYQEWKRLRANHLKDVNNVKFAEALRDVIVSLPTAGAYTFGNMSEWDLTPVEFKHRRLL